MIPTITNYANHHSSCPTCIICDNNKNESMNGNQQGIAPSELMSLWLFAKVIKGAIHSLHAAGIPIKVSHIVSQLTDHLIDAHDGTTSLFAYKTAWTSRIVNVLQSTNTAYARSTPNWEKIWMILYDKKLGILHNTTIPPVTSLSDTEMRRRESSTSTTTASHSDISTSTDSTSSSFSTKQSKLTPSDKENIKKMYQGLDQDKTWKLSTGTIVEKKMEELALACNYEHPVHSLIIDTSDKSWLSYFTKEEMAEIAAFKPKKLDELPPLLSNYIEELKKQQDIDALKKKLAEETDCSACEWARCTVLEYLRLFKYQYLPLLDQTEGDMMRRIWFFIDTVFDSSPIQCRGGEKSSKASSISRNAERVLSGIDKIRRKMVGRKVDLLFSRQSLEYSCCECGRYDDATKELNDGGFKMTKVLKDMLHCIYKSAPSVLRDVVLPGFVLFETKFKLMLCDAPAGHVCRIIYSDPLDLPEEPSEITNQLLSILTLTYKSRLLMEKARHLARNAPATIHFDQMAYTMLSSCYHPEANKQKRRRDSSDEA